MKKYFILVLLLIVSFSYSAEIYVNAELGNNITGDGSAGNPYATITKALVDCSDGVYDTIYFVFSKTTLAEEITLNKQRVTIVGIGNSKPKISGLNTSSKIIQDNGINNTCDSFYISNIKFDSPYFKGIEFNNIIINNININNCYFHSSYKAIDFYMYPAGGINNYKIYNNVCLNHTDYAIGVVAGGICRNGIIRNNYIYNSGNEGIYIHLTNHINLKIYDNIFSSMSKGIASFGGAENVVKYLEYNNFYNCTTDIVDNNPPTIKYNLNPYLLTSDTLGVDTFYIGYFSDLTPDTLINGGTGTYKQIGLDWEGQKNNIFLEKYFEPDAYAGIIANNIFSIDTKAGIIANNIFSIDTKAGIIANNIFSIDTKAGIIANNIFSIDTKTLILSNNIFSIDTKALILSNNVFSYDTQALILLSDNYPADTCNLTVFNSNYTDSENIIARLIPNDTLTLIPLAGQQFFNNENITFQWNIPKGANTIFLQTAKDSNYTIDTTQDTITGINQSSFQKSFPDVATYYWRGQAKYVP